MTTLQQDFLRFFLLPRVLQFYLFLDFSVFSNLLKTFFESGFGFRLVFTESIDGARGCAFCVVLDELPMLLVHLFLLFSSFRLSAWAYSQVCSVSQTFRITTSFSFESTNFRSPGGVSFRVGFTHFLNFRGMMVMGLRVSKIAVNFSHL